MGKHVSSVIVRYALRSLRLLQSRIAIQLPVDVTINIRSQVAACVARVLLSLDPRLLPGGVVEEL